MIRKIIVSLLLMSIFAGTGFATYQYFLPKTAPLAYESEENKMMSSSAPDVVLTTNTSESATAIMARPADDEIQESRRIVYYCNQENQDCGFVESQIFSVITQQLGHSLYEVVEFMDVATLQVQSASKRKTEYGFAHYPAFVIYDKDSNGAYIKGEVLEYNSNAPWTVDEVKDWLTDNDVVVFE